MFQKSITSYWKIPIWVFLAVLILSASYRYCRSFVTVSTTVNGRELPIYSVETDEKKVALSFDAACAASKLRY